MTVAMAALCFDSTATMRSLSAADRVAWPSVALASVRSARSRCRRPVWLISRAPHRRAANNC